MVSSPEASKVTTGTSRVPRGQFKLEICVILPAIAFLSISFESAALYFPMSLSAGCHPAGHASSLRAVLKFPSQWHLTTK
jgi:hypothetical protein